jgi:hypothetical protein
MLAGSLIEASAVDRLLLLLSETFRRGLVVELGLRDAGHIPGISIWHLSAVEGIVSLLPRSIAILSRREPRLPVLPSKTAGTETILARMDPLLPVAKGGLTAGVPNRPVGP